MDDSNYYHKFLNVQKMNTERLAHLDHPEDTHQTEIAFGILLFVLENEFNSISSLS